MYIFTLFASRTLEWKPGQLIIQLSELEQCGVNEIAQTLNWQQEHSKSGSLDEG